MALKPLPTDQSAYVGTDGKPATVFYTWLKSLADVLNTLLATFFVGGTASFAWTTFTATIAPETGSITAYTANGRFTQIGKIVFFWLEIDITNNGTGGGTRIVVTLPPSVPAAFSTSSAVTGVNIDSDTSIFGELRNNNTVNVRNYNATYPGYSGADLILSGTYEAA